MPNPIDGYSRADARQIMDIGKHASVEAIEALLRVTGAAPPSMCDPSVILAMAMVRATLDAFERGLTDYERQLFNKSRDFYAVEIRDVKRQRS